MQLIRPAERHAERPQRVDLAKMEREQVASGAMSYVDLENLIRDIEWEPEWRRDADTNAAYYDGYQTTPEQERLRREGQPVTVTNLIARTVNVMLGNEAKARANWKLSADSEEDFGDVSDALQVKLTEAQRETMADMSISEGYGSQTKAGLGWVEVSRVANVFAPYPYRVKPVHRNEIWWDWRAKELDLSDARWLIRQQWHDLDDLEAVMPEWRDLFRYYGQSSWSSMTFAEAIHASDLMRQAQDMRQRFKVSPEDWLDTSRKRIKTYEVWYRVIRDAVAMFLPDGTVKELNPQNPMHQEAVNRGMAKLQKTWKQVLRMAMFVGPHRLMDIETERTRFPYIPFWAFRDDIDRSPYSMVQGMRSPQDEYNARRSRLMWLLQAAQVFVDDDALSSEFNNLADLYRLIMRPDAVIVTNPERRNKDGIRVERSTQLPAEQANVMMDAKNLIMEQPGVSATMMGDKVPGVSSGLAFNSLVTQSNVAIGDHDDNYRLARRLVGEALVELIVEDSRRPNLRVKVGTSRTARVVVLNTFNDQGLPVNHVAAAPVKVALDDAPSTPAYRMQQQVAIGNALQASGNDPVARAVLLPAFIESSDLPDRAVYAKWMRQQYGVPQPGDRDAEAKADAQRQQAQAQQQAVQQAAIAADLEVKKADAEQKATAADLNRARIAQIEHQISQQSANEDQAIQDSLAEAAG